MTSLRRICFYAIPVFVASLLAHPLLGGEIARANLDILGLVVEVDRQTVETAIDVPAYVQTIFGGKTNDEAQLVAGLSVIGELTGPGLNTPITLATLPGRKFALPAMHEKGEYVLQNIRLVGENGEFLQQAIPSFATIQVEDALRTEVRTKQLTPDQLRERGITIDSRNYDVFGRLIHEADEFAPNPYAVDEGNVVRYLYDETGRLARVIDPLGRTSILNYFAENAGDGRAGRLKSIEDWRGRVVDYQYDGLGRLISAALPAVSGMRPTTRYGYDAGSAYNAMLEFAPNLLTITDPQYDQPRVTFTYGAGDDRDKVTEQNWKTREKGIFTYGDDVATVHDALKQERKYALTPQANDGNVDRPHVRSLEETDVETSTWAFGSLPASVQAHLVPRATQSRRFSFGYEPEGMMKTATLAGVRTTTYVWSPAEGSVPGFLLESQTTAADSGTAARSATTNTIGDPLTRTFGYDGAFVKSFRATQGSVPSALINIPFVRANSLIGSATNDAITESIEVDRYGRPKTTKGSGGTDTSGEGTEATLGYSDSGARHELGLLKSVDRGGLVSTIDYPNANTIVETDAASVQTTTELDEWLRPKHTFTSGASLRIDESTTYDENGRVREVKRKQGGSPVTETIDYDAMGRVISTKSDRVAVGESLGTIESRTEYDIPNRTIKRTLPSGAVVTEHLDGLGRVKTRTTSTSTSTIREEVAYDMAGNLVYSAGDHVARGFAFDIHGRPTMTLAPDRTTSVSQYDAMGQPVNVQRLDANGTLISETNPSFTASGRLQSMSTKVDETRTRNTETRWDGGGRSTLVATEGRASQQRFDRNGLLRFSKTGGGTITGPTEVFHNFHASRYEGVLLKDAEVTEKNAAPVAMRYGHDELANATSMTVGSLTNTQKLDEAGNVTSVTPPSRGQTTFDYDARGNMTQEKQPESRNPIRHGFDASGAATSYRDQSENEEVTSTQTDQIGRPLVRTYSDGTSETFTYDGSRLSSRTDRQRRMFSYVYKADTGQLIELRGRGGELLEKYGYDAAGRLEAWTTKDVELRSERFDLEGRPRRTKQIRFADESGFTNKTVLNEFVQEHTWNLHGERSAWTMPLPPGFAAAGWTSRIEEVRDGMGNIHEMRRTLTGETTARVLMSADHRNASRPTQRAITTTTGAPIVRTYGYDARTGQLNDMTVSARGIIVAGSGITYDGEQVGTATLHGVSDEARVNEYSYDDRGRLKTSKVARTTSDAGPATEVVSDPDFRKQLDRSVLPGLVFTEQTGHKIADVTRGQTTRTFSYGDGAERIDDGRFVYEFDVRGRLTKATEKVQASMLSVRRVIYLYAGSDRLIGRRAEYAPLPAPNTPPIDSAWKLEDRSEVLGDEGLPAETTFVWDPITDTLVTVAGATGEVLRQFIHGGAGYDDPIEVAVSENGVAHRLYPVFDEPGAGTLQAILNQEGELVSRTVEEGAYGEDEFGLAGAAVDRVALAATKTPSGQLGSVTVSIRTTEQLAGTTVANGGRLSVLDGNGAVVRSATTTPQLFENYTLRWTLTPEEWTALTSTEGNAAQLSISVTNTLRASAWDGDQPILPAPDATSLFTSPELPVESRKSLAEIRTWLATESPEETKLFEATSLSALAGRTTPAARLILSAGFQALPFTEPATGLIYARARWYDPSTGTFLTPDPLGYQDSSNLYAFAGGDPVNGRDPTGESYWRDRADEILAILKRSKYNEWDPERSRLLAEFRDLLDKRYETNPHGPQEPGFFSRAVDAGARWLGLGDEVEESYKQALSSSYPQQDRSNLPVEITDVYGTEDRGAKLQKATFEDIGGRAVNYGTQALQGAAETKILHGASVALGAARKSLGLVRIGNARVMFRGMEVRAVRDLGHLSDGTLLAMRERGFAAKTREGIPIQLHHLGQSPSGPIVEIPEIFHSTANKRQHPRGTIKGAGLTSDEREVFNTWREDYWKARADEELARRGL